MVKFTAYKIINEFLRAMNKPFHMLYWNSMWKAATKVIMQFHYNGLI